MDLEFRTKALIVIIGGIVWALLDAQKIERNMFALLEWLGTRQTPEKWGEGSEEFLVGTEGWIIHGPGSGKFLLWSWEQFSGAKFTKPVGDDMEFVINLGSYTIRKVKKPYDVHVHITLAGSFRNMDFLDYKSQEEALAVVIVVIVTCIRDVCLYLLSSKKSAKHRTITEPAHIIDNKDEVQRQVLRILRDPRNEVSMAIRDTGFVFNTNGGFSLRKIVPAPSITKAAQENAQATFQRVAFKQVSGSMAETIRELRGAMSGKKVLNDDEEPDWKSTLIGTVAGALAQTARLSAFGETLTGEKTNGGDKK